MVATVNDLLLLGSMAPSLPDDLAKLLQRWQSAWDAYHLEATSVNIGALGALSVYKQRLMHAKGSFEIALFEAIRTKRWQSPTALLEYLK